MEQRRLGRTGYDVSVIGLGTWQFGPDWGDQADGHAAEILAAAVEAGINFIDTADVYGDGRSEKLIGRFCRERGGTEGLTIATKIGRRAHPHTQAAYNEANFRRWLDRSRRNLGVDRIDLVQLHCPPAAVYSHDQAFDALDAIQADGIIAHYGVSVETEAEALRAITRPGVASVQIVLNILRRKPLDRVLPAARAAGVGVIARVPLASGLLTGKFSRDTVFAPTDHRSYNRHGEAFDQGETFAGVPYEAGLEAAERLEALAHTLPDTPSASQVALRWCLDQAGVTCAIPGASSSRQVRSNATAAVLPRLSEPTEEALADIYDSTVRKAVHHRW
jgi:aryl-alcohol dehydrogenase-like predicted oxidoreductase